MGDIRPGWLWRSYQREYAKEGNRRKAIQALVALKQMEAARARKERVRYATAYRWKANREQGIIEEEATV